MRVLGIESSCDETAAAVYDVSAGLLSSVVSSQVAVHGAYGGVVPELASREHLKSIVPVVGKALSDASTGRDAIDGIAVTAGPGLIGSLLVGLCFAKSLAFAWGKPLYGADHLEAHVHAVFLESDVPFPYIALLVSGGHTSLFRVEGWGEMNFLGGTRDDAAGEAFDKAAKMMGLPYPGGVAIDRAGREGDAARFHFPRAWLSRGSADFSFSGLKTALRTFLVSPSGAAARMEDVAASFQEAVADVLVGKAIEAAERERVPRLVLAGGVSANSRLRELAKLRGAAAGITTFLPSKALCTDNAAMVALLGERRLSAGVFSGPGADRLCGLPVHPLRSSAAYPRRPRPVPPQGARAELPRRPERGRQDRRPGALFPPPFLEIGPGLGALTSPLADAGAPVVAVEVDRGLAAHLRGRLAGAGVEILEADFLAVPEQEWRSRFPAGGTVVGNLPYSISSPVVLRLIELRVRFPRAVLMLQREVVDRLCAGPGGKEYGILSVYLGVLAETRREFVVRRACFHPAPDVDSAVMSVRFVGEYPEALVAALRTVVRAAFAHRRKTLRNAPVPFLPGGSAQWRELLRAAGIDPAGRAEEVPPAAYLALARAFAGM